MNPAEAWPFVTGRSFEIDEIGVLSPGQQAVEALESGEVHAMLCVLVYACTMLFYIVHVHVTARMIRGRDLL